MQAEGTDLAAVGRRLAGRLAARRASLGLLAAVLAALLLAGSLSLGTGVAMAVAAALAWSALWPLTSDIEADPDTGAPLSRESSSAPRERTSAVPLWRQMLEALPEAALVLDDRDHVIAVNTAAISLLAARAGHHIALVNRSPELLGAIERASETAKAQTFDLDIRAPVEHHLAGLAAPLRRVGAAGSEPAMLLLLRDRTEAEQLAAMRADFVANASHELRTPLASLKGFIETLQGAARDDAKARERFLGVMQAEASRMARLIDDLLSLSRIEMREHVPPSGRVDLGAVVADVVRALEPEATAARITINGPGDSDLPEIPGDLDELAQVVQNLVQNAIKYGRPDGRIDITLAHRDSRVVLAVADTGIGIAPEHLPRLTERFYRVSSKQSRERGGTGLGLAIVKHIINRHRGTFIVVSTVGVGSTFTVSLPDA